MGMFSIFKSKPSPLSNQDNVKTINVWANGIVDNALNSAETERDFIEKLEEGKLDYKPENRSICDAAFEYWVFDMYLLSISLNSNKIKYKDGSDEVFVFPVFSEIYKLSKPLFLIMHKKINDAVQSNYVGTFDEAFDRKFEALRALPLAEKTMRINTQSAICLHQRNVLKCLNYDLKKDPVVEQSMILRAFKSADRHMNVYDDILITLRNNLK